MTSGKITFMIMAFVALTSCVAIENQWNDVFGDNTPIVKRKKTFNIAVYDDQQTARWLLDYLCTLAKCPKFNVAVRNFPSTTDLTSEVLTWADFVVTDWNIDGIGDGEIVCRKAKAHGVSCMVITHDKDLSKVAKLCDKIGCEPFIAKSNIQEELMDRVRAFLLAKLGAE